MSSTTDPCHNDCVCDGCEAVETANMYANQLTRQLESMTGREGWVNGTRSGRQAEDRMRQAVAILRGGRANEPIAAITDEEAADLRRAMATRHHRRRSR